MSKQTTQRPLGQENGWGWGPYWKSAKGCAFTAGRRKTISKLAPYEVRDVALTKAQAWVDRRPWLTERERARTLLDFAQHFYEMALDTIATQAQDAGDQERKAEAWRFIRLGFWRARLSLA